MTPQQTSYLKYDHQSSLKKGIFQKCQSNWKSFMNLTNTVTKWNCLLQWRIELNERFSLKAKKTETAIIIYSKLIFKITDTGGATNISLVLVMLDMKISLLYILVP